LPGEGWAGARIILDLKAVGEVLEEGQRAHFPPVRGSGSAVSFPGGDWGKARTTGRVSSTFNTRDGLS